MRIKGYVVDSAIVSLPCGATQIISALQTKLMESNCGSYTFQSSVEMLISRYVMEQVYLFLTFRDFISDLLLKQFTRHNYVIDFMFKACFVAVDYEEEVKKCANNSCDVDAVVSIEEFEPTNEMMSSFKVCRHLHASNLRLTISYLHLFI